MTAFQAEGCGIALTGDEYEVSVTSLPYCVIWLNKHSADWLAALAPLSGLRRTAPASGGRINRSMLSCRDMAPWLSTHSAPSKRGKGGGASHQRGHTGMVHEVYDALFSSPYFSFPLEGKSREAGKGVRGRVPIGCSIAVLTANRRPPERRTIRHRIRVS